MIMVYNPRAGDVPDGSLYTVKLADGAVTTPKIASEAVTDAKIGPAAVVEAKIATDAVTATKIAASAVIETKIATDAVTATKIAAAAVTAAKIDTSAVIEAKIATDAVTATKIAAAAVTEPKIATDAVTATKIAAGAVLEAKIGSDAVTTAKLADASVTLAKSVDALRRKALFGSEANLSMTGTVRTRIERFQVPKDTILTGLQLAMLIQGKVASASTGTFELWANNDADWDANDLYTGVGSPLGSITTTSTTGALVAMTADISALGNGRHYFNLSAKCSVGAVVVSTDLRQYFVKE